MSFTIQSNEFKEGAMIPECCTCDGRDCSPSLQWEGEPKGTQSFALIVDDPDAPMGTWDHWIIYNISSHCHQLLKDLKALPKGAIDGINSWGKTGYGGPCPPDKQHRYFFKLYALDKMLEDKGPLKKNDLLKLMEGHILAKAELMGIYDLKKRR